MILVSACLLGCPCKYSGGDNFSPAVQAFLKDKDYILCCPEQLGGLPTPRPPAELQHGENDGLRVVNRNGEDVTAPFLAGAEAAWQLCQAHRADTALLKEGSPSCGVERVYDGSFSGKKVPGRGITAALLAAHGVRLLSSEDIDEGQTDGGEG